jgi:hypothetical protein
MKWWQKTKLSYKSNNRKAPNRTEGGFSSFMTTIVVWRNKGAAFLFHRNQRGSQH